MNLHSFVLLLISATEVSTPKYSLINDPECIRPREDLSAPRSLFWRPLGSYVLPGLGQWSEKQWAYASTYSTLGAVGLGMASAGGHTQYDGFESRDTRARVALIGGSIYMTAGGLSAYHDFRTGVSTHREKGEYEFLDPAKTETPADLTLAPFHFENLANWTTLVPLASVGALIGVLAYRNDSHWHGLHSGDIPVTGMISYGAGVGEEAGFRGWLFPLFRQKMNSTFWANVSQATIFASLHISSDNPVPWPQFVLGSYLGWLAEYRDWQISEGIFIHAWWDVIALGAEFATTGRIERINLPPLQIIF